MGEKEQLEAVRARIDSIDQEMMRLINQRAECAQDVARIKREHDPEATFYRPEREAQVLRSVMDANKGPLSDEEMARLFREIMSACLALEQPLTVAYLGPAGTFTQSAALKHFGHSIKSEAMSTIDEVFREVGAGSCNYGVVPIENSTEGVITHTLDMFLQSPLRICGEVTLRIHHHLLSRSESLGQIRRIYSHQQSLAQCREWLDANLPGVERIAVSSNAEAAKLVTEEEGAAAIAGQTAAELYELNILSANIEDQPENTTRFLVIGSQDVPASGEDKTSLLVSTKNQSGSLYRLLKPLAENGVSMTRIESRPSHCTNWEYVFFLDIKGHKDDGNVRNALETLEQEADLLKILGSYPRAVL
jgi:chorismate mutase/prephenate dehydratase